MKAKIIPKPFMDLIDIILYDEIPGDKRLIYDSIKGETEEVLLGDNIPDRLILTLPHSALSALAEEMSQMGVKTDKDAKIEGTLGATRFHLEDLRKLLKLK